MLSYNAKQGDIVWIDLDPQAGHEQKGRRPAVIISNDTFNSFTKSAAMLCPITNRDRNSPLQVRLDERSKTTGVIMCDQAKILDIKIRKAEFIEKLPNDLLIEILDIIFGIIETE